MTTKELFEDMKQYIDGKFAMQDISLNVRFSAIDDRFDAMDSRFDAMDDRFDAMDERFDTMDQRFNNNDMVQNEILNAVGEMIEDHESRISILEKACV